ncbi:hypothetical protein BDQ12DRAFT_708906 [Crucibulum laeve]|uniref:Uncharacterized protein n=1 Tax=Crucibulum laeve TaxID=68775 RepID=A0A5C3MGJ7_9AGAR|nr:hypothetical protein BDQ12DRAFT_708906 [Crucibulum laeve]
MDESGLIPDEVSPYSHFLSAKELEQRRTTGHNIVKDAMQMAGECNCAPKEIHCKTCVDCKMCCPYAVDFSLKVLKANGSFSLDLSHYIMAHIKTVMVKVAQNKELSKEELGEEGSLEDGSGETKGKKGGEGQGVKGKGRSLSKRKGVTSTGSSKPLDDPLKILLHLWQVQVALPDMTLPISPSMPSYLSSPYVPASCQALSALTKVTEASQPNNSSPRPIPSTTMNY